jgi:glycosyltransferase involved in cell wall biosynthesis
LGFPIAKIRLVLNGVETPSKINKLASKKIRFGIVGQVIPRKGHAELVSAFKLLCREMGLNDSSTECNIYGDGDQVFIAYLRNQIEQSNLASIFSFKGFVSDKSKIYENLDVVVVPSHYEAFGFSALEPAFYKIPVIASFTGGLKEIIVDNRTGFFVNKRNPYDLAAKIESFVKNPKLIETMGTESYKHATQYFTSKRMVNEIEEILKSRKQ